MREDLLANYTKRWRSMIHGWQASRKNNAVWLMYAANYLFNTRGLMWAVDPVLLSNRVPEAPMLDVQKDLYDLDFILLTHAHIDHVDTALWLQLKTLPCHWIVPEHMETFFKGVAGVKETHYSVAVSGKKISIAGIGITPFDAPHFEHRATGGINYVDSTGYYIETADGTYLLPGDIRTYDPDYIRPFTDVSAVFAHVFLGRSAALDPNPPLVDAFVDFYLSNHPKKIVLTHLYELGREPRDCWLYSHAQNVANAFHIADDSISISIPGWFQEIML